MNPHPKLIAKVFFLLSIPLIFLAFLEFRTPTTTNEQVQDQNPITISATIYPLAYLATQVGGERVLVDIITPPGAEPHEYEPTPKEIANFTEAQIVLVNGGGIDAWAEKLLPEVSKSGNRSLVFSSFVSFRPVGDGVDPHFWLDPLTYKVAVPFVRDALIEADPLHALEYQDRATRLLSSLDELDLQYRSGLARCERRDVVTAHSAFGYLTARYELRQVAISGVSPESEPSLSAMGALVDQVKRSGATTVFFESLTSPKLAETLARETGAKTDILDPIEGLNANSEASENYQSIMKENLVRLNEALTCTK